MAGTATDLFETLWVVVRMSLDQSMLRGPTDPFVRARGLELQPRDVGSLKGTMGMPNYEAIHFLVLYSWHSD